jgi:hypothetical protein
MTCRTPGISEYAQIRGLIVGLVIVNVRSAFLQGLFFQEIAKGGKGEDRLS